MNYLKIAMLVAVVFTLLGCQGEPTGQGYIFEVSEDGRVLVLDDIDNIQIGKRWVDISSNYSGDAIWLKTTTSKYKVGQRVRYWVDGGVDQSFPAQASAKKIEIID
ncbi:hypothetical protein PAT3040_05170 [Paenibacillus agaridevorans]|uniref:DUF3221 domain-containing protein n=1 Tax=Paenibacillus agaridevorans TaxID=171404 RepID=A0A2R5EV52_9BACL|nr:YobA family protein [Paenibacillus agaridevorans]GBG10437.1 hypothetical protein PAT3040_05170 [Paenibacillus agaridevorans]